MALRFDYIPALSGKKMTGETFDLNTLNEQELYLVGPYEACSVQITPTTASTVAVITLYRSNNGKTPIALETPVSFGAGGSPWMSPAIDCSGFAYLHVVVTTAEGSTCTADIVVIGKATA